jgi:hypothetical protein
MHVYHYAGNNPVVLVDPDGRKTEQWTVVTGTTIDGYTMSYSAPSSDADRAERLKIVQNNMRELGWDVHTYQVDVDVGFFRKTVKGAREVGPNGTFFGEYMNFTSEMIKGKLQDVGINLTGSNILKTANIINNAVQFGKSMSRFIDTMNKASDGTAQLAYLLMQPGGAENINALANLLTTSREDYYKRGTLAFAKDGAYYVIYYDPNAFRELIIEPALKVLLGGISFCYF